MMSAATVQRFLERAGPTRSGRIAKQLGIPGTSLRRIFRSMGDDVLQVGKARATTYALRRGIDGVRTPVPVYEVWRDGAVGAALRLHPVQPFGYYVESLRAEVQSGFHETGLGSPAGLVDLPWFLSDLKPEGYLGRAWLNGNADQGYPTKLTRWDGDDVLRYAVEQGVDLPGAWVVGAVQRARLAEPQRVLAGTLSERAERSATAVFGGSSPGGEQPKFTLFDADGCAKLVKFSPPTDERTGERWADLLLAEHLAGSLLAKHGVQAATSQIVDEGSRRFLLIDRFDRYGTHGRSGIASLLALDAHGTGSDLRSWKLVTATLLARGQITSEHHEQVVWLEAFGHLIANSDMHMGNMSVRIDGTTIIGLAPVYDMLPMFHAPRHGVLVQHSYAPQSHHDRFPGDAVALARRFWQLLREHPQRLGSLDVVCENQLELLPTAV
jgi:hypothetical protein